MPARKYSGPLQRGKKSAYVPGARKNKKRFNKKRGYGNKISYDAIESIKNGLICNTKFETGYKAFGEVHIIVFANMEPDYEKLSEDRWEVHPLSSEYC